MTREELIVEFEKVTTHMLETMKAKNADYSSSNADPFHNFKMVELMGVATAEQGFFARITDKVMRLASFVKNGTLQVKGEAVEDTLEDLAVYAILMICYLRSNDDVV